MVAAFEVRDEVWEAVEPLLPAVEVAATGRPRVPDRVAFNAIAIAFVLVTGIAWRFVPQEPRQRPDSILADRGYDHDTDRRFPSGRRTHRSLRGPRRHVA